MNGKFLVLKKLFFCSVCWIFPEKLLCNREKKKRFFSQSLSIEIFYLELLSVGMCMAVDKNGKIIFELCKDRKEIKFR